MLDPLDSYYARFWKRFLVDATPWARDNIVWGVIVLIVPPVAAFFRDPKAHLDWALIKNSLVFYAFALVLYVLAYLLFIPKRLDTEREAREQVLATTVAAREQTIQERDDAIRTIREKPKRSAAEQHDYDKLKKALGMFKETGLIALRFIRSVGSLTFGSAHSPTLPPGLTPDKALWVYRHCASEGLLNCTPNLGKTQELFTVLPKMDRFSMKCFSRISRRYATHARAPSNSAITIPS